MTTVYHGEIPLDQVRAVFSRKLSEKCKMERRRKMLENNGAAYRNRTDT